MSGLERMTYNMNEAAEVLGIPKSTLYRLVKKGRLPSIKLGKRVLISRMAMEDLISGKKCSCCDLPIASVEVEK